MCCSRCFLSSDGLFFSLVLQAVVKTIGFRGCYSLQVSEEGATMAEHIIQTLEAVVLQVALKEAEDTSAVAAHREDGRANAKANFGILNIGT